MAYDSKAGIWLSRDPSGESGGLNLYEAFNDDPVNWDDPTGLSPDVVYKGPFGPVAKDIDGTGHPKVVFYYIKEEWDRSAFLEPVGGSPIDEMGPDGKYTHKEKSWILTSSTPIYSRPLTSINVNQLNSPDPKYLSNRLQNDSELRTEIINNLKDLLTQIEIGKIQRDYAAYTRNGLLASAGISVAFGAVRVVDEAGEIGPEATAIHNDYLQRVRPGAKEVEFKTPWSSGRIGTRRYDDFDAATGTGFEANTTPWSKMTDAQLARKLDQVGSDYALLALGRQGKSAAPDQIPVRKVIWFGTEELPTTGLGAQLRTALKQAGISYYVVNP